MKTIRQRLSLALLCAFLVAAPGWAVISSTTSRVSYTGDASTTTWSVPFLFPTDADVDVVRVDTTTGVETPLTLGVDYTLTGAGVEGEGTLTYPLSGSPLATTEHLVIRRVVSLTQPVDLPTQGAFYPAVHESAFDRATMQAQELQEQLDRTPKFSVGSGISGKTFPSPASGEALGWNASGDLTNLALTAGATWDGLADLASTTSGKGADLVAGAHRVENIVDHGGTCDGTADDTSAWTSAESALAAGGEILIPENVTCMIRPSSSAKSMTLRVLGTLKEYGGSSNYPMLTLTGSQVTIVGPGTIDGNKDNQSSTAITKAAVSVSGGSSLLVDGVTFQNAVGHGLYVDGVTEVRVRQASFLENGSSTAAGMGGSVNVRGNGFYSYMCDYVTISDSYAYKNGYLGFRMSGQFDVSPYTKMKVAKIQYSRAYYHRGISGGVYGIGITIAFADEVSIIGCTSTDSSGNNLDTNRCGSVEVVGGVFNNSTYKNGYNADHTVAYPGGGGGRVTITGGEYNGNASKGLFLQGSWGASDNPYDVAFIVGGATVGGNTDAGFNIGAAETIIIQRCDIYDNGTTSQVFLAQATTRTINAVPPYQLEDVADSDTVIIRGNHFHDSRGTPASANILVSKITAASHHRYGELVYQHAIITDNVFQDATIALDSNKQQAGVDWFGESVIRNNLGVQSTLRNVFSESEVTSETVSVRGLEWAEFYINSANTSVSTFSNPTPGQLLTVYKSFGAFTLTLYDNDDAYHPGNIQLTPGAGTRLVLATGESATFRYMDGYWRQQ